MIPFGDLIRCERVDVLSLNETSDNNVTEEKIHVCIY